MTGHCGLAAEFEQWRPHLSSVAYSMLGSVSEAEDDSCSLTPVPGRSA
jgi:hypothetical protein